MATSVKPRLEIIDPDTAQGQMKVQMDRTKELLGIVPNVFKMAANSLPGLTALNNIFATVGECSLGAKIIEQIALALSTPNRCQYCARAHSAIGAGKGLSNEEIIAARKGFAIEPKSQAAITLALELNKSPGQVSDALLERTRSAGISDEQIVEFILITTQNIFTHMLNNLARTPCEFPEIPAMEQ